MQIRKEQTLVILNRILEKQETPFVISMIWHQTVQNGQQSTPLMRAFLADTGVVVTALLAATRLTGTTIARRLRMTLFRSERYFIK